MVILSRLAERKETLYIALFLFKYSIEKGNSFHHCLNILYYSYSRQALTSFARCPFLSTISPTDFWAYRFLENCTCLEGTREGQNSLLPHVGTVPIYPSILVPRSFSTPVCCSVRLFFSLPFNVVFSAASHPWSQGVSIVPASYSSEKQVNHVFWKYSFLMWQLTWECSIGHVLLE